MFDFLFLGFATNLLLSCILTITAYNAVSALVALIFAFINATCIFFLMELEFIGLLFLIVYVGAVSVLFLFSVMLFNLKNIVRTKTTAFILKNIIILIFIAMLFLFFFQYFINLSTFNLTSLQDLTVISENINTFSNSDIFFVGQLFYGRFFLYLILAAIILLIAMLGAVVLIHNPKDQTQMQHSLKQITRSIQIQNLK